MASSLRSATRLDDIFVKFSVDFYYSVKAVDVHYT